MRRIADHLHAEPSNVTAIIDRLESRGLVERSPDPGDRRVKLVAATAAGRTVTADLRARMPFAAAPLAPASTTVRRSRSATPQFSVFARGQAWRRQRVPQWNPAPMADMT